jgi:hypothetical protein
VSNTNPPAANTDVPSLPADLMRITAAAVTSGPGTVAIRTITNTGCNQGAATPNCLAVVWTPPTPLPATQTTVTISYTLLDITQGISATNGLVTINWYPTPTFTSMAPNSAGWGSTTTVTLTGTNLTGATGINVAGPAGLTVTKVTIVNDTTVTGRFSVTPGAALGARDISVVVNTPGGSTNTNTLPFTVNRVNPALTGIVPAQGIRGFNSGATSIPVVITGTNLFGATIAVALPTGVTATNGVTVTQGTVSADGTQITGASFSIAAGASAGLRSVTAAVPGVNGTTSNILNFTVLAPALTGISPASLARGASQTVTLSGSSLSGATAITATGGDVNLGPLTVSDTAVSATFTIAGNAPLGARNVTVTTPGGVTNLQTFQVVVGTPTLASITQTPSTRNAARAVTLTGTNLDGGTIHFTSGTGITIVGTPVISADGTTITAILNTSLASLGSHGVTVTTPLGTTTGVVTLPVTLGAAALATVTQPASTRATVRAVTLTGTNLDGGTINFTSGSGITIVGTPSISADGTTMTATFDTSLASLGIHGVRVTTTAGNSKSINLAVTQATPTLASISPAAVVRPATGSAPTVVTLTGTNLDGGVITFTGGATGVSLVGTPTVSADGTTVTASFSIAANASTGSHNVRVTTATGNANVTLTVN